MIEIPKESLQNKTYKGVPLERSPGFEWSSPLSEITEKYKSAIVEHMEDSITVHVQRVVPDIIIDKEKLTRWVAMCRFLEEKASNEEKTAIGQWLYAVNLQEINEKLKAENEELKKKLDDIEKILYR